MKQLALTVFRCAACLIVQPWRTAFKTSTQRKHLAAGAVLAVSFESLWQDYLGMERYLAFAVQHWRPAIYSVPMALCLIYIALGLVAAATDSETKPTAKPDASNEPFGEHWRN